MIEYEESVEFKKDFKRLTKRFISLPDDFLVVKKAVIELRHILNINNLSTFEILGFSSQVLSFWKIKKFACKSLKGRGVQSGLRIVYAWHSALFKVVFLEIYFKAEQENENRKKIKDHLKLFQ
jgi:hypothetical protein